MKYTVLLTLLFATTSLLFGQELDIWGVPTGKSTTPKRVTKENAPNATDENGNKQGKWIKYVANQLVYKGTFKNNKPIGEFLRYYPNGKLKSRQNFIEDSNISYAELYNNKGKRIATGKYIGTLKDSVWTWYNSKGSKLLTQNFVKGIQEGEQVKFYPTGRVYEKVSYVSGLKEGEINRYYPEGQVRLKSQYKNDLLEGKYTTFLPEGGKEMEGEYSAGVKDGVWTIYNEQEIAYMSITYINGSPGNKNDLDDEQQKRFDEYEEKAGSFQDPQDFLNNPEKYRP